MQTPQNKPIIALVDRWGAHFGYYDGKIDLKVDDLSSFATPDCTLTAHAPLWGTKEGEESAVPAADVRTQLARMLRLARVARHDMHLALHPDGDALCLFFRVKGRIAFLPVTVRNVPLAFVVQAVETDDGLRISEVHEWPAADPEAARRVLVDHHDWSADTTLKPYVGFGAVS
jgi:hypothetical protein